MKLDNYLWEQVPLLTDPQIYRPLQAMCALATVSPPGRGTQKCGNEHDERKLGVFL